MAIARNLIFPNSRSLTSIFRRTPSNSSRLPLARNYRMMASASRIELSPATTGVYHATEIQEDACETGSRLLQENHDKFHMYFNTSGFHNHIAHHLLTIFALGASSSEIQRAFDVNKEYQRPQYAVKQTNVENMADRTKFQQFLGKERYFHDYETFFQKEVEAKGLEAALNEHVFAGNEHAERLHSRLFAGFLHPLIHLGFGIEFKQPAIVVEALAQAAIHDNWVAPFLLKSEEAAKSKGPSGKSLVQLINETRANDKIRQAPHWEDGNKIRDGILRRAGDEMIEIASQWTVRPDELEKKTAEMINATAYFTGASQKPSKEIRIDFFYMHSFNCSIFFSALLNETSLNMEQRRRLLEWKGRMDLAMYASRGSPELLMEEIINYKPKQLNDGWSEIIRRVGVLEDDGHSAKLIRAIAHGEKACKPYEGDPDFPITGDMWLQLGHMAIDSVEGKNERWIRNTGFEQAWSDVPDRARL